MSQACVYTNEVIADAPLLVTQDYMDEHGIDLVVHGDGTPDHERKARKRAACVK